MFKSSFAREILESSQNNLDELINKNVYPKERHTIYKSNFAASTHSPMDYITPDAIDINAAAHHHSTAVGGTTVGGVTSRYPLPSRNCNISNYRGGIGSDEHLGTSDFSSSEILSSNSERRNGSGIDDLFGGLYAGIGGRTGGGIKDNNGGSGSVKDLSSIYSNPKDGGGSSSLYSSSDKGEKGGSSSTTSFLNLQSQMPFAFLQQVCSDLDVGLTASDWSTLRQTVLPTSQEEGEGEEDGGSKSGEETLVVLGDFLSELQSLRRGKGRRGSRGTPESMSTDSDEGVKEDDGYHVTNKDKAITSYGGNNEENLTTKEMSARLAAKENIRDELETLQVRLECQHLYTENLKLRQEFKELKGVSNPRRVLELQKEIEHLHWQLNKMENSRKLYELATTQLVTFLEQVSHSLAHSTGSRSSSRLNLDSPDPVLSRENLLHARELSLASLNMARSQSMPGLAGSLAAFGGAFMGGGSGLSRRSRLMRGSRDGSTSGGSIDGSSVKRSNSVSRTRLASPLPSLAEQEDRRSEYETGSTISQDPIQSISAETAENLADSLSLDSHRVYRRSISAQDPLCMSTPRSNKSKLQRQVSAASRRSNYGPGVGGNGGMPRSSNSSTISITTDKTDDYHNRQRNAVERRRSRLEASKPERNHRVDYRSHGTSTTAAAESTNRSTASTSADRASIGVNTVGNNNNSTIDSSNCSNFEQSVDCISVVSVEQSVRSVQSARSNGGATTAAASIVTDAASVRSIELRPKSARSSEFESKRGTLTSLSSGSTSASPPSTTTSRSREYTSDDSLSGMKSKSKSMTTLNSGDGDGTTRTQLAATAQRLLRSLKFVLAREKSYNIVNAEGKYYKDRDGGSKAVSGGKSSTRGGENGGGKAGYKSASTVRRQEKGGKDRKAVRTRSDPATVGGATQQEDDFPAEQLFAPRGREKTAFDARSTASTESRSILKTKVAIIPTLDLDHTSTMDISSSADSSTEGETGGLRTKFGAKTSTKKNAASSCVQEMRNNNPEQNFRHSFGVENDDEHLHARQKFSRIYGEGGGDGEIVLGMIGKFNDDVTTTFPSNADNGGNSENLGSKDQSHKGIKHVSNASTSGTGRQGPPVDKPARTTIRNQQNRGGAVETATMRHKSNYHAANDLSVSLKRSKSDAQDIFVPLVSSSSDDYKTMGNNKSSKKPLSAIVKRSRSFQKLFSPPNIGFGRSKEYYFN